MLVKACETKWQENDAKRFATFVNALLLPTQNRSACNPGCSCLVTLKSALHEGPEGGHTHAKKMAERACGTLCHVASAIASFAGTRVRFAT